MNSPDDESDGNSTRISSTGTGTGRRTVTLPAPRFFLKITHTDTKFSEMQEGWKESRQQSRFAF